MGYESENVKKYLAKFPNTPSLTLAKLIYKLDPVLYKDVERVRDIVRYYRGKRDKSRDRLRDKLVDSQFIETEDRSLNPFDDLPPGLKYFDEWEPYHIEGENSLIIADTHIPYHEVEPFRIALEFGKQEEADTVLILGDFADFHSVSFWEKDPRKRDFKAEIEAVRTCLSIIRDGFPDADIVYKIGNHEERYERYMKVKAPELIGLEAFDFEGIFSRKDGSNVFRDAKIKIIGDKRIVKIGRLNCIHGHEFGRTISSPVNPARGLYLKGKELAMCAHFHQSSSHNEKSMNDNVISTWSIGTLSDLRPDYLPINKWNFGFCMVRRLDKKNFQLINKKIIDGEVYTS
jgi:predicted phosphodiesterase